MEKKLDNILLDIKNLNYNIEQIVKKTEFDNYEDLSGIEYDKKDPNELMIIDELWVIMEKLCEVSHRINYFNKPIKKEGILHKNKNGRYEIDGYEFHCGNGIEYLSTDGRHWDYDDKGEYIVSPYWCASSVEHNGKDYYIVGAGNIELEGLTVRVRL